MKRWISILLMIGILLTLLTACGTKQKEYPNTQTVYFKDITKSGKATATFYHSDSKDSVDVDMDVVEQNADATIFSCEGDCKTYNMVTFSYGDKKSDAFGFNPCISGWCNTKNNDYLPYIYGEEIDTAPQFDDVTLSGYGYDKLIHIWKPADYDAASKEKYAVVYALDGQLSVINGRDDQNLKGCPMYNEQIKAMTKLTGQKAILVLVENHVMRDNELVPKLGESFDQKMRGEAVEYDSMDGTQFCDFVATTLVPYVQKNYNVYTDAAHTAITGSSLGGLEAFYITMEHPEMFGTVGALSPAVWEFDDAVWNEYLSQKSFDKEKSPFIYLYVGGDRPKDNDPVTTEMYQRLQRMEYPADKLVLHKDENGTHSSMYWRAVFSEFLTAMAYGRIAPLQKQSE